MGEHLPAFELAQHIYDSFFEINGLLTEKEVLESIVWVHRNSGPNRKNHLYTAGVIDCNRVLQTFTLSGITGRFYLATTNMISGRTETVQIFPNCPPERSLPLENSLFMQTLAAIVRNRPAQQS